MMKKFPQLLLTLLLGFVFISVKTADLCPGPNPTRQVISVGTGTYTQAECVKTFEYTTQATDFNKYLIFEIRFPTVPADPLFMPYLLANKQVPAPLSTDRPSVILDSGKLQTPDKTYYSDTNGLINRKSYHRILVPPSDVGSTSMTFVFAVFKAYTDPANQYTGTLDYEFTLISTANYLCPQSCSGHGICSAKEKCECQKGYFDEDCSILANEITLSSPNKKTIGAYQWNYFYFNIGDFESDLKISLLKETGAMDFSFLINERDDFTIPNSDISNGKYSLPDSQPEGYLLVQEDNIAPRKNDILLIGAYNGKAQSTGFQVLLEEYDDSSVIRTVSIYLMIGISLALLMAWVGVSTLKYKHHTQMESLIRVYQVERVEDKTLTKKDINKYFPKEKFKDLKTSFCQTMCSVCLEDFEPETNCRQLYCEHIYHGNCIEAWLAQHYNCPNCKKDITKVAIEEYLKEKANKEEKSMLVQEKVIEIKDHSENPSHLGVKSGDIVGISPQRIQIKKPREMMEESKENHDDLAFENAENNHKNKHRNLTNVGTVHIEPRTNETNLQLSPSHEDTRSRNLGRGAKDLSTNNIQDSLSRNEINSRAQNLRRGNRGVNGTIIQKSSEAEADAFRLEL